MKKVLLITIITLVSAATIGGASYFIFRPDNAGPLPTINDEDPQYQNKVLAKPKEGTPEDQSAIDNLFIAQGVFVDAPYKKTTTTGTCTASVIGVKYNQSIKNRKIVNEDEAFSEALSLSSLKKVGDQRYVTKNDYLVRNGKNVTENGADWQDVNVYSKQKFIDLYGQTPFGMTNYSLNEYSIDSGTLVSHEGNEFVYNYQLKTEIATKKYSRETATMGGASSDPVFSHSEINVTMDSNWVISQIECMDSYNISIMGGLNCDSAIVSAYEYSSTPFEVVERADFAPFFGKEANDNVTVTKDGEYYLNEGLSHMMSAQDGMNVSGDITLGDQKIHLDVFLDLAKMNLCLRLDKYLSIYYQDDQLYVHFGDVFAAVSKQELFDVIKVFYPDLDLDSLSLDSLLASPAVGDMMKNMISDIQEDKVNIRFVLPVGEIKLVLDKTEETATFKEVIADLFISGKKISASIAFQDEKIAFEAIPDDVTVLTNIKDHVLGIKEFIEYPVYEMDLDVNYKDFGFTGNAYLEKKEADVILSLDGDLTYKEQSYPLNLLYQDHEVYLNVMDQISLKLTVEELKTLINEWMNVFNVTVPSTEDLLQKVPFEKIDWAHLLETLVSNASGLSCGLNVSSLGIDLFNRIEAKYQEGTFTLDLNDFAHVEMKKGIHQEKEPLQKKYCSYDQIAPLSTLAQKLIHSQSAAVVFNHSFVIGEKKLDIDVEATLSLSSLKESLLEALNLNVNGIVRYDGLEIDVALEMQKGKINLWINEKKLSFQYDELKEILEYLQVELSLDKKTFDTVFGVLENGLGSLDLSSVNIDNILKMIFIQEDKIGIQLQDHFIGIKIVDGNIALDLDSLYQFNVTPLEEFYSFTMQEIQSDLTKDEAKAIIRSIKDVYRYINNKDFIATLYGAYEKLQYRGEIRIHLNDQGETLLDQLCIDLNVTLTYGTQSIPLRVQLVNKELLVSYKNNIKIVGNLDEIVPWINDILVKFGQSELTLPEFSLADKDILKCLVDLVSTDSGLEIQYSLIELGYDLSGSLALTYASEEEDAKIQFNLGEYIHVDLGVDAPQTHELSSENAVTLNELTTYIDGLLPYISNKCLSLHDIDLNLQINEKETINLTAESILVSFKNGIEIDAFFTVLYQQFKVDIGVIYKENTLYLSLGEGVELRCSVSEAISLIEDIETKFNFDFTKIKDALTKLDGFKLDNLKEANIDVGALLDKVDIIAILDMIQFDANQISIDYDIPVLGKSKISLTNAGEILCTIEGGYHASVSNIGDFAIEAPTGGYKLTIVELKQLVQIAYDAYSYKDQEAFTFTFSGTSQDGSLFGGTLAMTMCEDHKTIRQVQATINISEKTMTVAKGDRVSEPTTRIHNVHFVYDGGKDTTSGENNRFYFTYKGENEFYKDSNGTQFYIDDIPLYTALGTLNKAFIHNSLLEKLFGSMANGEQLDIFDYYDKGETEILYINDLISSISINNKSLNVSLLLQNKGYDIQINDIDGLLSGSLVCDLFTLNINKSSFGADINVPTDLSGYYNFSSIDGLLTRLVNTIALKQYSFDETILNIKAIGLNLGDLTKVEIKELSAFVDENNKPLLKAVLRIPGIATNGASSILKLDLREVITTIYFDGEYIYALRHRDKSLGKKEENIYYKWSLNTFTSTTPKSPIDRFFEAVDLMNALRTTIKDSITNADEGNNHVTDYDEVLKNYSYNEENGQYTLSIDGIELLQDKNMDEISATLTPHPEKNTFKTADVAMKLCDGKINLGVTLTLKDEPFEIFSLPDWAKNITQESE